MDMKLGCWPCSSELPKLRLTISDSVRLLNRAHWEEVLGPNQPFLTIPYLQGLETAMEESMEFRYVIFYCEEFKPFGIAYYQIVDLVDTGSKYAESVKKLGFVIGKNIVQELKVRSLVSGNVFHTGEHGYRFLDKLSSEEQLQVVEHTAQRLKKDDELHAKVSIVVFKEYWPNSFEISDRLVDNRYHMFRMDMNMIMDLRPEWKGLENYEQSLHSKARTRIRSIMKRSAALEFKDFGAEQIASHLTELDALFHNVLKNSPFTFGVLKMEAYVHWKKSLGNRLLFRAVYCQDKMVGFMSAFENGTDLDVHYVGIDYDCNKELGLYQRMLIELLDYGLQKGFKRINFGRTAEQAKSSLGARPVEMRLYTKHRNSIANRIISPLMAGVVPTKFETRNPFKK